MPFSTNIAANCLLCAIQGVLHSPIVELIYHPTSITVVKDYTLLIIDFVLTEVGEEESMSLDLYSLMPSLPNIEGMLLLYYLNIYGIDAN